LTLSHCEATQTVILMSFVMSIEHEPKQAREMTRTAELKIERCCKSEERWEISANPFNFGGQNQKSEQGWNNRNDYEMIENRSQRRRPIQ
jgi:hypothetical protein